MLENFFNRINKDVDEKRTETPSSMAPTLKKEVELKPEDLVPVVEPSEKAPTIPVIPAEHVTELVEDKDIHGPLDAMGGETLKATDKVNESDIHGPLEAGAETLPHQEAQTLKTDATIAVEKQAKAEHLPTVRADESLALKAVDAQTFKTGETIAREDAAKEAAEQQYQEKVAQEKMTLRKIAEGYMEYDAIHNRVTEWLKTLDEMLATPQSMEELVQLKVGALKAKEQIESQLDLKQREIAKTVPGATPFTVEVPAEWPQIEARLNEINEGLKADTLREQNIPTVREEPTIKTPGPEATA